MINMKKYLIYKYASPSQKIYIGQTCETIQKRAGKNGSRYKTCPAFWKAIQKYGWEYFQNHCEILAEANGKEQANALEKYYINLFKANNSNFGYNILKGGYEDFGIQNCIPIVGIELATKQIRYFSSLSEAEREIGVLESVISQILQENGQYNTSHGWTFLKKNDYDSMSSKEKEQYFNIVPQIKPKLRKQVRCINTGAIYSSITEAAQKTKSSRTHISSCCLGKRKCCGKDEDGNPLKWEYC